MNRKLKESITNSLITGLLNDKSNIQLDQVLQTLK